MKQILLSLLAMSLLSSCITYKASFTGEPFAQEQQTFDAAQLNAISQFIKDSSNTTSLVVLHKGKMVYQYGDISKVSYLASCRKSVLSMLYGKYIDNGTIDLNQDIGSLGVDEKDGLLAIEKTAKVDHIITSRSGVFHVASNGGYDKENFLERGSVEPGSYFVYSNWDFNVAGHLFEQYAGRSIYEELEDQLAKPLGFQDWNLKNQRKYGRKKHSQYKAYHMYLSTRDMAKIGQLMLNQGTWKGEQLISKRWVKKSTSTITSRDTVIARRGWSHPSVPDYSYGYMWWLFDEYQGNTDYKGSFSATGYGGQYITVIPGLDMVVAHKTVLNLPSKIGLSYKGTNESVYYDIVNRVVEARKY